MAAEIAQMPEAPTAANMDVSLQISLPQMLDLALGAPEVGAVNFNILHNFLHILLHQINLQTTKVEYRGENADRIKRMVTSLKPSPVLQLHEYNITDATGEISRRIQRDDGADADVLTEDVQIPAEKILEVTNNLKQEIDFEKIPEAQTIVSVENGFPVMTLKELEQSVKQLQERYQALEDLSTSPEVVEGLKDRIADPTSDIWQFININKRLDTNEQGIDKLTAMVHDAIKGDGKADIPVINARLNELENKVSKMEQWLINLQTVTDILTENIITPTTGIDVAAIEEKEKVEATIAAAEEIEAAITVAEVKEETEAAIEAAEEKEETEAAIEAAEEKEETEAAIDAAEEKEETEAAIEIAEEKEETETAIEAAEEKEETEAAIEAAEEKDETEAAIEIAEEKEETEAAIEAAKEKEETEAAIAAAETVATDNMVVPHLEEEKKPKEISKAAVDKKRKTIFDNTAIGEIHQDVVTLKTDVARIQQELQDIDKRVTQCEMSKIVDMPLVQERPVVEEPIKEKIVEVSDASLEQCLEAIKNVETTYDKALNDVTQRMIALEREIGYLLEKVSSLREVDKTGDVNMNELIAKVQGIEMDMDKIGPVMNNLFDDKEKQKTHINTLLEQIELLKTIKANKEDLEDALANKADTQTVNRKVSHDQFNAACDDLAQGLKEAINKLTKQESIWQQALDEIQNEIATKMDKVEMMPLKDFVNNKLKSLQEKLKIMIEARREIEAAGTKKLLRDVQCISCNKDVVMKTEELGRFYAQPLPCTFSMKPYLTCKLDKARKQQRRLPHSRNMIQFEAIMQEEAKRMKAKEEMLTRTPRDHLVNRYCGGSHTITTPRQRVMRTGQFFTQWGPEVIQLTDGLIMGKNGQMYRGRPIPGKDVCGPDCWESQINEEIEPSECASTTPHKSLPSRRNSARNRE